MLFAPIIIICLLTLLGLGLWGEKHPPLPTKTAEWLELRLPPPKSPVANAPFEREYVTTTGYCNGPPCTNTTHGITKSGIRADHGVCAADWDVYPRGTEFIVPGYGYCRVEDTGRLIKGKVVDLYFNSASEARQWGRRVHQVWRVNV